MRHPASVAELLLSSEAVEDGNASSPASATHALLQTLFGLQLAQRRVTTELQQQTGLSESDLVALGVLMNQPPSPVKELSAALGLTAGSTSTLVERLTRAGMVDRTASRTDRRVALVTITAHGIAVMSAARDRYLFAIGRALETCTSHCLETTTHVLEGITAGLDTDPASTLPSVTHDLTAVRHIVESIRRAPQSAVEAS